MSHIAQSNAWEWIRAHSDDERLRAPERLVLLTLANRLNHKTADLHPSVARIAEDTRLSTSSCRRALRTLEDLGAVTSRRSYGSDGRQLPNDYEISSGLMTRSQDTAPREDHGDSAALDVGAVTLTPPPGHTDTPPRSEGPPPPVTLTAPPRSH